MDTESNNTIDIRIDDASMVRIFASRDVEHCEALAEESKVFFQSKCFELSIDST